MIIKRIYPRHRSNQRGQSFVELLLVVMLLALLLSAVVEYGFLMNNYLHVVGAAREGARVYNDAKFYNPDWYGDTSPEYINNYYFASERIADTMAPVKLNPSLGDDIIISIVGISGNSVRRFPGGGTGSAGWSLCAHYQEYFNFKATQTAPDDVPVEGLADAGWFSCTPSSSRITNADLVARASAADVALTGMILVEVVYNYPQVLKLPLLTNADVFGSHFSIIPDPVPLYAYTIMPMSSAMPTP